MLVMQEEKDFINRFKGNTARAAQVWCSPSINAMPVG